MSHFCVYICERNTNKHPLINQSLPDRSLMLRQIKIFIREHFMEVRSYCSLHHPKVPGEAPRNSFTKMRDPLDEEPSLFHPEQASFEAKRTLTRNTIQWWYHTADPLFGERGQSSGKRSASSATFQGIPSILPSCCSPWGERVSKHEAATPRPKWKLPDMKDNNRIESTSVTVPNKLHSFLIRTTKKMLAQRPFTLILMMINSFSYSANDLVLI